MDIQGYEQENAELKKQLRSLKRKYDRLNDEKSQLEFSYRARMNMNDAIVSEESTMGLYLEAFLKKSDDFCIFYGEDSRLMFCTDSFVKFAGFSSLAQMQGKPARRVCDAVFDSEYSKKVSRRFRSLKDGESEITESAELSRNGRLHSYIIKSVALREAGTDKFLGIMTMYTDVTRLSDALAEVARADEAKTDFLMTMSHEIRTPINAILGMSNIIRIDNFDDDQLRYIEDIKKASRSLLQVLGDVIDFTQMETGKTEIRADHFDMANVYDNVCSFAAFQIDTKPIEFVSEYSPAAPRFLYGDRKRVRQILTNILSNAVKYTARGTVTLIVSGVTRDGEPRIKFTIDDTGGGIPEDEIPHIFEAFRRRGSMSGRDARGAGLGLAVTYNFVKMMGGTIDCSSVVGAGSTFTVELPAIPGDPELVLRENAQRRVKVVPGTVALNVDDSEVNHIVAKGFLERHGIITETADSGREALEMVANRQYDIIFMDHMMPEMDGAECTKFMRNAGVDTPIVALTANTLPGVRAMFLRSGMNDFIPKPLDARMLNKVLIKLLPEDKVAGYETVSDKDEAVKSLRVLLGEESFAALAAYRRPLEHFDVTATDDADELMSAIYNAKPNVVVIEPAMSDGFTLIERIRGEFGIPVVAVTRLPDEKERLLAAGVAEYVAKPFIARELTSILEKYVSPGGGGGKKW